MRWRSVYHFIGTAAILAAVFYIYYGTQLLQMRGTEESSTDAHHYSVPAPPHQSKRLRNNNNNDFSRNDTTESSAAHSHWPLIQRMMCHNKIPNPNVWSTLFELARMELGLTQNPHPSDLIAFDSFFKFNYGGLGYYASSDDDQHANNIMIYLRIFKAGNDQIRHNLQDILGKSGGGGGRVENWNTMSDLFSDVVKKATDRPNKNKVCVVTVVRDPVEHFLSAYNEIEFRQEERIRDAAAETITTPLELPPYTRHENGTIERFEQFVTDLISGPRSAGLFDGYKKWGVQQVTHTFSMTGVLWGLKRLKDCHGKDAAAHLNLTAYLPSLTNLDTEFPKLLQTSCPGLLLPQFDSFEKRVVHDSQSDKYNFYSAAKQSWRNHGKISRALCAIHALDYACFENVPIPSICHEVYSKNIFRHGVLRAMGMREKVMKLDPCGRGNFP